LYLSCLYSEVVIDRQPFPPVSKSLFSVFSPLRRRLFGDGMQGAARRPWCVHGQAPQRRRPPEKVSARRVGPKSDDLALKPLAAQRVGEKTLNRL